VAGRRRFAGVVLVDQRGWVLLQERDEHPQIDPDCWGLVGGHVEPDEDVETAAYRELTEETEVVATPGSLRLFGEFEVDHTAAYGSWDLMTTYAAATDLTDDDIVCHEGRRIVFVDPEGVPGLPLTKGAGVILPAFLLSDLYRDLTAH
jgi:ADP-ribose pyrophosphatase YjhB (NUDIX family)